MERAFQQGNNDVRIESNELLSPMEVDAIGEILNISMGSAATAISTMLDKQVLITTPKVAVKMLEDIDFTMMEPAMLVKITYVEGVTGSNVMVFRQTDMQMILNQLMGIDETPKPDFVFDELSMSAACEVMNQMMGAAATALSEFLGRAVNISPPTAMIMDHEHTFQSAIDAAGGDDIVSVVFDLSIKDIMKSEFVCVMTCDLAKIIVRQFMHEEVPPAGPPTTEKTAPALSDPSAVPAMPPSQSAAQSPPQLPPQPAVQAPAPPGAMPTGPGAPTQSFPLHYAPTFPAYPAYPGMQPIPQEYQPIYQSYLNPMGQPVPPNYTAPLAANPMMPSYGYPPPTAPAVDTPSHEGLRAEMAAAQNNILKQPVNVQSVQFPNFPPQSGQGTGPITGGNMDLIMNVPLSVTVEIGKTKKKIRDIMEFCQGTVIELEKQAGAPVDIVVNGQLFARGDVVVIDDNFGVRVTEIIGTSDLLNSVSNPKG